MRYFLLCCMLIWMSTSAISQTINTYTTARTGNYKTSSTWGAFGPPPESGVCNCRIIVSSGHTLTIDLNLVLTDANFVLQGTATLTFGNSRTLELLGTSSIDIQSNTAKISKQTNTNTTIKLKGEVIFTSNSTRIPSTAPLGTVQGPASASSLRSNPNFQNFTLPVTLSDFKLTSKDGKVTLLWTTDLEINSDHFEIERSGDGKRWEYLASVNAAGNVSVAQHYSFTDNSPVSGDNYYRLKIVDIDTKYEYSPIKMFNVDVSSLQLVVGPNPASSVLHISVIQPTNKDYQLKLINRSGQIVYSKRHSSFAGRISIPLTGFTNGAYFVEVTDVSGSKIVKNILIAKR